VVQRNQFEVDSLNKGPNHPILLQSSPICSLQLLLWARAFHNGHAAKENKEIGACEDSLISSNAREHLDILISKDDLVLEELEPGRGCRTEDSYKEEELAMAQRPGSSDI